MNPEKKNELTAAVAVGFGLFALGLLAWLWTGEWRWAVTGLVALVVLGVFSAVRKGGTR